MTSPGRLIIAPSLAHENGLVAINLDDKTQCAVVTYDGAYEFMCDCIGLSQELADAYGQGEPIAMGMSADDWALWCEACPIANEPAFVWLTICKDPNTGGVRAVNLADSTGVATPGDEANYFAPDCLSHFKPLSFNNYQSFVTRMTGENWEVWLKSFAAE